jgi:tetratricopeptide (TPR) repeat protein
MSNRKRNCRHLQIGRRWVRRGAIPFSIAVALAMQPDPASLRRLYEDGLARRERQYGLSDARTARAASDLGLFLRDLGDVEGARRALAGALTIDEKALGPNARVTLADAGDLASVSEPAASELLWRRAAESPDASIAARSLGALGELREAAGDRDGAARFYRQALSKEELSSGKDGARVAVRLNALALALGPETGIPLITRAVAIDRRIWGERHPETATAETNLSGLLLAAGRTEEAVRIGRAALSGFEATLGADHPRTAGAASNLADALRARGDRAGAEHFYRRALEIDERAYGRQHPETLTDVHNLADFLRETGRPIEARELERQFAGGR